MQAVSLHDIKWFAFRPTFNFVSRPLLSCDTKQRRAKLIHAPKFSLTFSSLDNKHLFRVKGVIRE